MTLHTTKPLIRLPKSPEQLAMELPTEVLSRELERRKVPELARFAEHVAQFTGIPLITLCGPRKPDTIAKPRMAAMAGAYENLHCSLKDVALAFGRVDHSTVIHALKRCGDEGKPELRQLKWAIMRSWRKANP